MASGPSLTAEDAALVKASGHPVVVTNTTFRLAPWADVVFGMDAAWWREHHKEVESVCTGRRMSTSHAARAHGAESLYQIPWFGSYQNSGAGAVGLAMAGGAVKVVLLGYDSQFTGGKKHWHGDHPKMIGNAASLKRWPKMFEYLAKEAKTKSVHVVNASRDSALTCFERVPLESAL